MAQQGNEILKQILGVCVQINKKMDSGGKADKGSGPLSGMFGSKTDTKKAKESAAVIKEIFKSITDFSKTKVNTKKIDATSKALKGLFETVIFIGRKKKTVENAINLFDKLAKSLDSMTKFANAMTKLLLGVGASIVAIAGGIALAGILLGTKGNPLATLGVIVGVLLGLTGALLLMGMASKQIDKGSNTAKHMGQALMWISAGLITFMLTIVFLGKMMGATGANGIVTGLLGVIGLIAIMGLTFSIMGMFKSNIIGGAVAAAFMGIGMVVLSLGLMSMGKTIQFLSGLGGPGKQKEGGKQKGKFGQMMSEIGPGLGVIAIMTVSAAIMFALLGIPVVAGMIALGAGTTILLSFALVSLARATKKVMGIAAEIGDTSKIRVTVREMVEGAMGGLLDGVTNVLSGGKKGIKGFAEGIKNTAILMNGIALLMGVSVALSMFAKALTAFASLDNMRVIESYDEKTGEPKFGDTVNIRGVGDTIRDTLVSFLVGDDGQSGLLGATEGLRKRHGSALKRMGRALTGRRGILRAVNDFAEVLKTFAQFGPEGKVGYIDMIPDGVDEDGEVVFKQVPKTVLITEIVTNIGNSFSKFVTAMAAMAQDFEFGGKEKRKMQRLSTALSGKKGILNPIIEFSQALEAYSKMGEKAEIIRTDAEGKPILKANGEPETIPISQIAVNAAKAVTAFANSLNTEMENISKRDARQTGNKLEKFEKMIATISSLGEHVEGINKSADALTNLATSISALVGSMDKLDPEKLNSIAKIAQSNAKLGSKLDRKETRTESREERRLDDRDDKTADTKTKEKTKEDTKASSSPSTSTSTIVTEKQKEQDYDKLGQVVGQAVSAAFKNGQFTFEFATDKSGVLNFQ